MTRLASWRSLLLLLLLAATMRGAAAAQLLLVEDFEDGAAEGWAGDPGRGSLELTRYNGNVSMRLSRNASAVRRIDLADARRVMVSGSFAAQDLEDGDACLLEFSSDGGEWMEIGRIENGADDGVTLHRISGGAEIEGESRQAYVGVRIKGNAGNDVCWADDIVVAAVPSRLNLETAIPEQAFWSGQTGAAPYAASAFAPPAGAAAPPSGFEGVFRFAGGGADHFFLLRDDFNYASGPQHLRDLPPLEIGVVQHGGELVPLARGPMRSGHPDWEWIVEPGRIWAAPDGGLQAAFPFALQERNANCIHNGLAAFRVDKSGAVSNLVYQIGSETCAYMQFDLWGAGAASFERRALPGAAGAIEAYKAEIAARLETRPIGALHPDEGAFGSPQEVNPGAMTLFGYVADGVHYTGGCETRYGTYPFCDVLDLPSYSWAKSMVAGVAAMRLEKLYPGAMNALIRDYAPACGDARWDGVTFGHALDMATGVFTSKVYEADENGPVMQRFFLAETHAEKMEIACTAFERKAAPGEEFVYLTANTYLLGAAMNAFLRERTGDMNADFYSDLLVPIWRRLGLSPPALETRRTRDSERQPFTGWGLTLHRNDIALIAGFLQNGGVIAGEALLDEAMLAAAMQKNPDDRGLPAIVASQRYKYGFWAWNAGASVGCAGDVWIPVMSGYGGLTAAFLPNGALYYYVSDGGDFAWRRAALASNALTPFCEATR